MRKLEDLINRIIDRVNINLREPAFDVGPYVRELIDWEKFTKFYAFYGLTSQTPLRFHFGNCNIAGSYFLGKCFVDFSVVYKCDVRGDELKSKEEIFQSDGLRIRLHEDESIIIKDSFLVKTLIHNHSHDPENPESFLIQNTVSLHYANIHGAPVEGSFLGPFSTIDLTTIHDCVIGNYAYVQVGELTHKLVEPGTIWIRNKEAFEFEYQYDLNILKKYIDLTAGSVPTGIFMEFVESRKEDFVEIFERAPSQSRTLVPTGASLSRYAVVRGQNTIEENVLVAQRSYLENTSMGKGANAQENCYLIDSTLQGFNVTAHGGKVISADLGKRVFVGFNSFLRGSTDCRLKVGDDCVVMPHTIIDLTEPLEIPSNSLVWGFISNSKHLETNSIDLDEFRKIDDSFEKGRLKFTGSGDKFVRGFRNRVQHILEANGAFFESDVNSGHAQLGRTISFNIVQPYREGLSRGLYPTVDIMP
ncbi:MAG: hypothetical protein PHS86_08895 [Syntrophaceae bacterium]|nr:hypothetical protein [Syntrophaceae bacterium]